MMVYFPASIARLIYGALVPSAYIPTLQWDVAMPTSWDPGDPAHWWIMAAVDEIINHES